MCIYSLLNFSLHYFSIYLPWPKLSVGFSSASTLVQSISGTLDSPLKLLQAFGMTQSYVIDVISGKKPPLFYTGRFPHRKEPPRRAALSVKIMVRRSVFPDHCPRITYYLSIPYCAQSFVNSSDPMKPSRMDSRLCPFLRRSIHAIRPFASASRFRKVR